MKVTDLRCARIGRSLVVRICSDEGIDGFGELGPYRREQLREHVNFYREFLIGKDPTLVERTVLRIRRLGGMKPWGCAVSAIEMALWDLAGKAADLPVHRLLGGKIRDRVRVYNGQVQYPSPRALRDGAEGFTLCKAGTGYHGGIRAGSEELVYGELDTSPHAYFVNRGALTEPGLRRMVEMVTEVKEQLGDQVGLAVDCGPGWSLSDAIRFAVAVEPLNLMWLEDLLTGDYTPNAGAHLYRELTQATTTPIHTGEQVYRRENFRELIETRAVDVIGPDPLDVGGIAELKWVAEYADLHGIAVAPHGVGNGLLGLGALTQVCATLPQNFIAFEYPVSTPEWYEIVEGLAEPIVREGHVQVGDRPGIGVSLIPEAASIYLSEQDKGFFD